MIHAVTDFLVRYAAGHAPGHESVFGTVAPISVEQIIMESGGDPVDKWYPLVPVQGGLFPGGNTPAVGSY
jgi:hypothetical protein